jgi:purine-binding chemotaxis protein CheW
MKIGSDMARQKAVGSSNGEQLVTFKIGDQLFGIPALRVRDVLRRQPLTRVPLARPEIAGAINLRGHIVTAIDVRSRLGAPQREAHEPVMCVVVESGAESFCLLVDSVGDVISTKASEIEPNPGSLQSSWAHLARGVYRDNDRLLLILDVDQLLAF